ncbi:MAG: fibronectin type III domain-containing protein, partial [Verrucomicrobiota bacterium]
MAMQVYTLSGVDTNFNGAFPLFFINNAPYGTNGSVVLSGPPNVPAGSWGVVNINYGFNGNNLVQSTSGTLSYGQAANPNVPNYSGADVIMGGIANLAAGNTTVSCGNAGGGGVDKAFAVVTFAPYVPATVPAIPTNVVATPLTNAVALSWANTTGGGTTTSYVVSRSTTTGTGYAPIATNNGIANTNYTDASVTDWVTYYYVFQAANASGQSPYSPEVNAVPVGLPTAPTGLVATWGVNMATLNWNPQVGATNWNVLRSTTSGSGYAPIASVTTNNYVDTGLVNWTTYYYILSATNNFGTGPDSAQVSVIPAVPLTNWIGVFHTPNDVTNWFNTVSNGGFGGGYASFYADAPSNGPSTGCLLFSNIFWTNYPGWDGIRGVFNNLNESNATALEFDFKCEGPFDSGNGIQSLQPSVESTSDGGLGYDHGGIGAGAGSANNGWVHIVVPITADDAGNVANWTFINQINLNVVDGYYDTPTNVMLGYANLEFTGAPGYPPVFSNLANPSISAGTPSVTLTGTVSGGNGNYLANGTLVSVTISGNTQTTTIDDNTGDFSINFTGLASLSSASYPIAYVSASDNQIFLAGTNNST